MSVRANVVLSLLLEKLSALNLRPTPAGGAHLVETQLADNLVKSVNLFDQQNEIEVEECEELYESNYTAEQAEPVFEDLADARESFSYDYICKVLQFVDSNPNASIKTITRNFRRVRHSLCISEDSENTRNILALTGSATVKWPSFANRCSIRLARMETLSTTERSVCGLSREREN